MEQQETRHETEEILNLSDYYHIIVKHKWLIITSFMMIVSLTVFFTLQMRPVYRATGIMIIDKEQSVSPLTGEKIDFESYVSQSLTFNTHFKRITARPVLEKVIKNLKLDELDREKGLEISPLKAFLSQFKKNIYLLLKQEKKELTSDEQHSGLVEALSGNIKIEEVRDTRLLKINVEDYDPVMARDIANELAKIYIEFDLSGKFKSSQSTLSWMTDQLYEIKRKLEKAEADFQAYKEQQQIFSIEGKQNVITQKIEEFNDAYLKARNERLELDARLEKLNEFYRSKGNIRDTRSLIDNPLVDSLYAQLLEAEVELNRLGKVFKSKHPKLVQVGATVEDTRKKLDEELKKEIENLKARRSIVSTKENVLSKTVSDFEKDAMNTNKKELRYSILQRDVDTNQKLYDTLLAKIKESNIEETLDTSNIRLDEEAVIPLQPVKPKKMLNFILSLIFGLMTGVGFAFLREYLDRSIRTEEDVRRYLGIPVLSVIPEADKGRSSIKAGFLLKRKKKTKQDLIRLFLENYPVKSRFAEAYRTLRTNIYFSFMEKPFQSLVVTSAGESEGKTATVANLAYIISQTGKSVLMIDSDLRRPMLSRLVDAEQSPGLTGLISGIMGIEIKEGSLEELGVSDLFRIIRLQKKTGMLRLSDKTETVEVFFLRGVPIHLNWPGRPEDKKLAALLVREGVLAQEDAETALDRQKYSEQKIGLILINMGLIREDKLKSFLGIQMVEGLRIALQMTAGDFFFTLLPESDFESPSFYPVELNQLYKQMLVGEERLPYLQKKIESAIFKTATENLFLLPTGPVPPNPAELLGSEQTAFLISYLKKRFDVLIFDTPPVLPASDALILAPHADGAALVIRGGMMSREILKKTVEQLRLARANLIGVALNRIDVRKEGYYRYYHKYYPTYYGERD